MCKIEDYRHMILDDEHRKMLNDELDLWHQYYLPKDGVEGKCVIDGGGGCGETAMFFLLHGASKVLIIESDYSKIKMIEANFTGNKLVDIIHMHVDFMKWDIEGGERNMIVETHFLAYLEQLKLVGRGRDGPAILTRYTPYEKTTSLLGWLHMKRINIATRIRMIIDAI